MDHKDPRDRLLCPKNNILVKYRAYKSDAVCNHDSRDQKDHSDLDDSLFLFFIHAISCLSSQRTREPRQTAPLSLLSRTNGFRSTRDSSSSGLSCGCRRSVSCAVRFSAKIRSVA